MCRAESSALTPIHTLAPGINSNLVSKANKGKLGKLLSCHGVKMPSSDILDWKAFVLPVAHP